MKSIISIIVALGLISSMATSAAYAGGHHRDAGFNPLWAPIAILSTLAAVVTVAQPPVIHERRTYCEPRHTVVYDEPRHYRSDDYYSDRRPTYNDHDDYERPHARQHRGYYR